MFNKHFKIRAISIFMLSIMMLISGCDSEHISSSSNIVSETSSNNNTPVSSDTDNSEIFESENKEETLQSVTSVSVSVEENLTSKSTIETDTSTTDSIIEELASSDTTESVSSNSESVSEETVSDTNINSIVDTSEVVLQETADTPTYQITGSSTYVFRRNEDATIHVTAAPNTEYFITVYYSSGESTAEGLHPKTTDGNGNVSWTWHIGGRTKHGTYDAIVSGNGERFEISFEVID